eukprot:11811187-Ditylum_brightwellii.AAC.1
MDPRWGASGELIKSTIDIDFLTSGGGEASIASLGVAEHMAKDNFGGTSSPVYVLKSSANAHLQGEKIK